MRLLLIAALSLTSVFALADKSKKAAPAKTELKEVAGQLNWTGYGVGKSHAGTLAVTKGQVEFKGEQLVGGTFTIDMQSLATPDSDRLQGHLRSADFFEVDKHKEATFKITKVEAIANAKAGEATHTISGILTIKGKSHPETFSAVIAKEGTGYKATAKAQIADRTKYDIVYNSAKFKAASALGDKLIEDKIDISLDIKTK